MMTTSTTLKQLFFVAALTLMAFFTVTFATDPKYSFASSFAVVLFALPCYLGVVRSFGLRAGIQLIALMYVFALVLENLAIMTGFPYGTFVYGSFIGQTIGYVPWTVGFAWTPILFGAVSLTRKYLGHTSYIKVFFTTAVLMTTLDFVLDPGSVALGFWVWENTVGFYGIPWSNFVGWVLSSLVAAATVQFFLKAKRLERVSLSPLMHSSFIAILVFWTAVCVFEQLWGAALIGCVLLVVMKTQLFSKEDRFNR